MNFDLAQPQATERAGLTNAFARPHLDVLLSAVLAISGARPSAARSRFALVGLTYAPWRLARSAMADTGVAYLSAEDRARVEIDRMLAAAGWVVQDARDANLAAGRGVAVREFVLRSATGGSTTCCSSTASAVGVDRGQAGGRDADRGRVAERRSTSTACPTGSDRALEGALPFVYESTGTETRFTNRSTPSPQPAGLLASTGPRRSPAGSPMHPRTRPRRRLAPPPAHLPPLDEPGLWPAQVARDSRTSSVARGEPPARADPDGDRLPARPSPPPTSPTG